MMAPGAVSFGSIDGRDPLAAKNVGAARHCFNVVGIAAAAISAEMVCVKPIRDIAPELLVYVSMEEVPLTVHGYAPVPVSYRAGGITPAACRRTRRMATTNIIRDIF